MRNSWLILLASSASLLGCGSIGGRDITPASIWVNPTALTITPKTTNKQLGQTQQFVARASFDNGTSQDVTGLVQWSSSNPALASVGTNTGLATALLPGQVTITARSGNFSDTATLTIIGGISLVSVDSVGAQGSGNADSPAISSDGRFVAFTSAASNLVPGDTNGRPDIFVHDRHTGATSRVNVSSSGVESNGESFSPSISGDGRFVAFESDASSLVTGDNNRQSDVFVHDRQSGTTTRVSVDSTGAEGNLGSNSASISGDGRLVAFRSRASNLVTQDSNGVDDIFVHDRQTGTTTLVSLTSTGIQGNRFSFTPSISGDGRFVAFASDATNLVANDSNVQFDVFVRDRQLGTTTRVSLDSSGGQGDFGSFQPSLSGDGRLVAFGSGATNLVTGDTNLRNDIFVHDRQTGATSRVSVNSSGVQANGDCARPSISSDGRFVTFESDATDLVADDTNGFTDAFLHDRQTSTTTRVSVNSAGVQGDQRSRQPVISADGIFVAFTSRATNLINGDSNGFEDIFVTNR